MALPRYIPEYTVEDYLQWDGTWELWSGVPIAMSPSATREHQRLCKKFVFALGNALSASGCEDCEVLFEVDWRVADNTVLRPDFLVTCGHPETDFVERTPVLVGEVISESSRQRDTVFKRDMYEQLGVNYYILVDPGETSPTVLVLSRDGYKSKNPDQLIFSDDCRISAEFLVQ